MAVAVGEALVYAVLARSAATIAQAEGGDSFSKSVVAAIRTLADQPFGPVLLLVLAAGLAVFAVFCLFDARYRTEVTAAQAGRPAR